MYEFKLNRDDVTLNIGIASKVIGIDRSWLSQVLNKRKHCTKIVAFCITKYLDEDAEIDDYFIKVQ